MTRVCTRLAGLLLLAGLAGCNPTWPPAGSPGKAACSDPCGAMACPTGTRCTWNDSCQASCTPESPPSGWKP